MGPKTNNIGFHMRSQSNLTTIIARSAINPEKLVKIGPVYSETIGLEWIVKQEALSAVWGYSRSLKTADRQITHNFLFVFHSNCMPIGLSHAVSEIWRNENNYVATANKHWLRPLRWQKKKNFRSFVYSYSSTKYQSCKFDGNLSGRCRDQSSLKINKKHKQNKSQPKEG